MQVINNSRARQGIHVKGELVMLEPGKSQDLELEGAELDRAKSLPFLGIEGVQREQLAPTLTEEQLRSQYGDNYDEVNQLTQSIADSQARLAEINRGLTSGGDQPNYTIQKVGRTYSVFDAQGAEVKSGLNKGQSDEFSGLDSDEAREAWVTAA